MQCPVAEREQKRQQEKGSNVTLEVTLARAELSSPQAVV